MGGGVGARPHRPFPEVPASAALAGRSGLPPGGPGPVSATEERQLLSRREQAGGLAGACSGPGARAGHPPRSFRARARLPPGRDARVHARLESRDLQLPPDGGAGPRAFGAREQRADPRRRRGLWRDARRSHPPLLRQLEPLARTCLGQQRHLRRAVPPPRRRSGGRRRPAAAAVAGARSRRPAAGGWPDVSHGARHRYLPIRSAHAPLPQLDEEHRAVPGAAARAVLVRAVLRLDGAHRRRLARLHPGATRPGRYLPHPARQLQADCALPSARGSGVTKTVLVLRFSAVGDVVLTAPAIAALREAWPDARIVYAIKERLAHLVEHNPNIDEVIALRDGEGPFSYASRLRAARPSVLLDLHGKIRSRILRALLPGVPKVVWHKRDFRDTLPVKLALRPYRASMLFADRYHAAVEEMVGRPLPKGKLQYFLGPEDLAVADGALRKAGLDPGRPLLGLSPGANWATKRWPAERFSGLARRALERGVQVAVQGSTREADLARTVVQHAPGTVDLSGKLDLRGLGGFIARCAAFASNDSGPMHMARALGVPTLAFFGSTDPSMFDFRGHEMLFAGVACAPCSFFGRRRCPRGHFRCMLDLTEDRAWGALEPLLSVGPRPLLSA